VLQHCPVFCLCAFRGLQLQWLLQLMAGYGFLCVGGLVALSLLGGHTTMMLVLVYNGVCMEA
jgi:hypothetical protein